MHHNDARRAFSCPGRDSFIGGNVISDRFNRFCLPPDLRAEGPHAEGSIEVVQRNDRSKFFLNVQFCCSRNVSYWPFTTGRLFRADRR
jgi:hypothetical protein